MSDELAWKDCHFGRWYQSKCHDEIYFSSWALTKCLRSIPSKYYLINLMGISGFVIYFKRYNKASLNKVWRRLDYHGNWNFHGISSKSWFYAGCYKSSIWACPHWKMPLNLSVQLVFSVFLTKTAMQASDWKVTWSAGLQCCGTTQHMHALSPWFKCEVADPRERRPGYLVFTARFLGQGACTRARATMSIPDCCSICSSPCKGS